MPDSFILPAALQHCLRTVVSALLGLIQFALLTVRSLSSLAAANLFLRKQLALFQERKLSQVGPTTPLAGSW
jgi:hypothetical protein